MAIVVSCGCGKQLRARDDMAGKKAKCPGCNTILRVPEKEFDPEQDVADLIGPAPHVPGDRVAAAMMSPRTPPAPIAPPPRVPTATEVPAAVTQPTKHNNTQHNTNHKHKHTHNPLAWGT